MKTATVREAQHHFSKLLKELEHGEEIVITRRGVSVGKLVPMEAEENPFTRRVDWSESIRRRNEVLGDLPQLQRNIVLEMREEERY
ncbi:type II toxin-antitoxin system Phd/YefM family antitoxin [Haloferula sp. A504]|uniref:type II toxin-antitoxin system Phd/YefM family antitoxin n=1 Tax=Haloferula sp. A504 TaxID=3373601 RepID=UPI0031C5D458|nr:type II toxin-antitoxin system prevent-host-death family antitoxin [Verrucomicrobiaceae bacterium E54]